jgi:hypothetical protein
MTTRFKLGRIHSFAAPPVANLASYATQPLPPPATSVAVPGSNQSNWGMDGNDQWGDCTIAGVDHVIEADSTIVSSTYSAPALDDIKKTYFGLTGGPDSGLVIADVLKAWQAPGLFSNKLSAYAPVNPRNTTALQQCIEWFGAAYVGVNLPATADAQFKTDGTGTWDLTGTAEDHKIEGGHCIVLVGYDSAKLYAVTWGAIVGITYAWWTQYADEAWATITQAFVDRGGDARGLDLATLQADLSKA